MPGAVLGCTVAHMHYVGVSDERVKVINPARLADQWEPTGTSHAVIPGTVTTLCGHAVQVFWPFYGHSFAETHLKRCAKCAQLAT